MTLGSGRYECLDHNLQFENKAALEKHCREVHNIDANTMELYLRRKRGMQEIPLPRRVSPKTARSRSGGGEKRNGGRFYVGNIPYNATDAEIGNLFGNFGVVTRVRRGIGLNTNRPKGFGFCEFQDQQGAQNAINIMNGVELNVRQLRVNWASK